MLFHEYVNAQADCSAVALHALRKRWMDRRGADGMVSPLDALAARITHLAVGGRLPQTRVFLSASHCATTTGRRASAFCRLVATSLKTPVSSE